MTASRNWSFVGVSMVCLGWCSVDVARGQFLGDPAAPQSPPTAAATPRLKLVAEDPPPPAVPEMQDREPPRQGPRPSPRSKDPTVPGPDMRGLIDEGKNNEPAAKKSGVPDIRLRARIITPGKPAGALIEIGGAGLRVQSRSQGERDRTASVGLGGDIRSVREGQEFTIISDDGNTPVKVLKITKDEVLLDIINRNMQLRLD